jgi:hypothetical protein
VVRDIVKAYYDKKNRIPAGTVTADDRHSNPAAGAAVIAPAVAIKEEEMPSTAQSDSANRDPN